MIVGTAGHVDHGKSTLVEVLTGREMDRAPEARRRGMTMDLGFAPLALASGRVAEMIDVPGHEDFLRTMIAGASGIDAAILVVAADEGIMPQTEEHLRILEMLGVAHGVPVLSRIDLVDAEWLELVRAEVVRRVHGSPVAFAPPVPVAAREGRGVAELRAALDRIAQLVTPRPQDDLFRLPIDRVMHVSGIGTVVAGTCWSGTLTAGAEVRLAPGGTVARVRSIQSQAEPVPVATAGRRIALALAGIGRRDVRRGMTVLSASDTEWPATRAFDAALEIEPGSVRTARFRARVALATDEVTAWVRLTDPGHARVTLDRPLVTRGLDRFVLRGGDRVIGGGRVLDPLPEGRTAIGHPASDGPAVERVVALVSRRRRALTVPMLAMLSGIPSSQVARAVRDAPGVQRIGDRIVADASVRTAVAALTAALGEFHQVHPAERGIPLETLRRRGGGDSAIVEAALVTMRREKLITIEEGLARAAGFRPHAAAGDAVVRNLVMRIAAAGLAPPTIAELAAETGRPDAAALLRIAAADGEIEPVERDRYFARTALSAFLTALAEVAVAGEVSIGPLKDRVGVSRKYLIPLLEWADRKGHTVRHGDTRRLKVARDAPAGTG